MWSVVLRIERVGDADAVSTVAFSLVQGPVGGADDILRIGFRHGDGGCDTKACGDIAKRCLSVLDLQASDGCSHLFGNVYRTAERRIGQDRSKLLATITRQQIAAAIHCTGQGLGKQARHSSPL